MKHILVCILIVSLLLIAGCGGKVVPVYDNPDETMQSSGSADVDSVASDIAEIDQLDEDLSSEDLDSLDKDLDFEI